jgi:hypothetical protein
VSVHSMNKTESYLCTICDCRISICKDSSHDDCLRGAYAGELHMDVASDKASPVLDIRIYFPMPAMRMLFSKARSYLGTRCSLHHTGKLSKDSSNDAAPQLLADLIKACSLSHLKIGQSSVESTFTETFQHSQTLTSAPPPPPVLAARLYADQSA